MQWPQLGRAEMQRRRSAKRVAITLLALLTLAVSVSAFADTYNFFFAKPKKGGQIAPSAPEAEEEESQEEAPKKVETAKPAETSISGGTAPIVIHNNNSIGYPYAAPPSSGPVLTTPVTPTPTLTSPASSGPALTESISVMPQGEKRSSWKMALTGAMLSSEYTYSSAYNGRVTYENSRDSAFGGLVSLGYAVNRNFGLNLYGGAHYTNYTDAARLLAGLDLDILPFHLAIGDLDLFDFGFLVGASTAKAASGNLVSLHAGARLNVNFGDFGLTGSARANLGYALFEAGLTARI